MRDGREIGRHKCQTQGPSTLSPLKMTDILDSQHLPRASVIVARIVTAASMHANEECREMCDAKAAARILCEWLDLRRVASERGSATLAGRPVTIDGFGTLRFVKGMWVVPSFPNDMYPELWPAVFTLVRTRLAQPGCVFVSLLVVHEALRLGPPVCDTIIAAALDAYKAKPEDIEVIASNTQRLLDPCRAPEETVGHAIYRDGARFLDLLQAVIAKRVPGFPLGMILRKALRAHPKHRLDASPDRTAFLKELVSRCGELAPSVAAYGLAMESTGAMHASVTLELAVTLACMAPTHACVEEVATVAWPHVHKVLVNLQLSLLAGESIPPDSLNVVTTAALIRRIAAPLSGGHGYGYETMADDVVDDAVREFHWDQTMFQRVVLRDPAFRDAISAISNHAAPSIGHVMALCLFVEAAFEAAQRVDATLFNPRRCAHTAIHGMWDLMQLTDATLPYAEIALMALYKLNGAGPRSLCPFLLSSNILHFITSIVFDALTPDLPVPPGYATRVLVSMRRNHECGFWTSRASLATAIVEVLSSLMPARGSVAESMHARPSMLALLGHYLAGVKEESGNEDAFAWRACVTEERRQKSSAVRRKCSRLHRRVLGGVFGPLVFAAAPSPPPRLQPGGSVGGGVDDGECVICFEPMADKRVLKLPCAHTFHSACMRTWVNDTNKDTCPLCVRNVFTGEGSGKRARVEYDE